jgi:hypothetical protein
VGDFDTCVGGEVKVRSGGLCLLLLFMRVSCFLAFISRFMVQRMKGSLIKAEDDLRVGFEVSFTHQPVCLGNSNWNPTRVNTVNENGKYSVELSTIQQYIIPTGRWGL